MLNIGAGEGRLRPPSNPGLSRRCRSTGRSGAQPPNPRRGALLAQRRTAVVAADLTPAEQVAFDQAAEALRLPNAGERAHEAVSGVRELSPGLRGPLRGPRRLRRLRRPPSGPAAGGAGSLPAGITRAGGAGCKRPQAPAGEWNKHSTTGPFFATKGGVACSPDPDPARQGRRSASATGRTGSCPRGGAKALAKGGVALVASERGPDATPHPCFPRRNRARIAPRAGGSRRDGDAGRRRAVSRSADRGDRRGRPARPRHGGGRGPVAARRAAVRRCRMFPPLLHPVRLAVPDPAARCAREWLDVREVPAVALSDSGLPGR